MLSVKNLIKTYQTKGSSEVKALDGVSIDFPETGMVFILGKSGSGKSTLLNLLGGLDAPTEGEIIFDGKSSVNCIDNDFDNYRNTYVGFVFQEYNLIDTYTVGENISLALELQGKLAPKQEIDDILRQVDLIDEKGETLFNRHINELSGGQKQRVAIARALIKKPKIIIADEPTGALDSDTSTQLYDLIKKLSKEKLVIVVSHDKENAEQYGDRIVEIKDGKIARDTGCADIAQAKAADIQETQLIRSNLPVKRMFAMGASGLFVKKFRLTLSVILSIIAFTVLCFALVLSGVDMISTEIRACNENDFNMMLIRTGDNLQRDLISEDYYDHDTMTVFEPEACDIDIALRNYYDNTNMKNSYFYDNLASYSFTYFAELDPLTGMQDAKLVQDERFIVKEDCRLPQAFDEIVITDLAADIFIKYGFKSEDGTIINIATPDDLIGQEMDGLKICGVYTTEYGNMLKKYDDMDDDYEFSTLDQGLTTHIGKTVISYGYVKKGFLQERGPDYQSGMVLIKMSDDFMSEIEFIKKLKKLAVPYGEGVTISTAYSGVLLGVSNFMSSLSLPGVIIAIVFTVMSILMTLNFLTVNIDTRRRELGILRALGARRKDIMIICLVESTIKALFELIVSIIATVIICIVCNILYSLPVFNLLFYHVLLMLLVSLGVTAIATVFPVWRIVNKKPIDIINGK